MFIPIKFHSTYFYRQQNLQFQSLFIPLLNISTHSGNPSQNEVFHGASSGSVLLLNNPRNILQATKINDSETKNDFVSRTAVLDCLVSGEPIYIQEIVFLLNCCKL